ncbi:MAG: Daunorubicin/doxorubicin resistance ATP-binding protein DrrA [Candidatus Lokiarchaeum sp. GC14_75]|nr:MAG: Daunorubicin/doxorubicin resistance ATP-binding protein DrrA [Candidatus Lokiarchaeum sp. GC14_75]
MIKKRKCLIITEKYAILTNGLSKKFGKVEAVRNLNLKIPYGVTYGLLGPNGAGKTTTVRMLNSIITPTSGSAKVVGYDITTESQHVKVNSGFLPETPGLYQKLTAKEFLEFVGELYYLPKKVISSRIDELLDIFDLEGRENDLLEGYSRGMKQKVCLCAALIQDPKIIFLDEPTSNLDPAASRMVKDLISDLTKKADKTIFICTHLLDAAEELCDLIGIIDNGLLKVEGSPKEIITSTGASDLEDAYLKIMGVSKVEDLLAWRDETPKVEEKVKKKRKRKK